MTGLKLLLTRRLKPFLAQRGILYFRYHHSGSRPGRLASIWNAQANRIFLLNQCEALQLISCVEATTKIPGCLAEVGVAQGVSSNLIAEYGAGRTVHLFDTFAGLPKPNVDRDSPYFKEHAFCCSLDNVQQYLAGMPVVCHKGVFPRDTGRDVEDDRFAFVHLDVDLYDSTIESLRFFYPRMVRGGIILSHDYVTSIGVNGAFREFFADKSETVIELSGDQGMVVKL